MPSSSGGTSEALKTLLPWFAVWNIRTLMAVTLTTDSSYWRYLSQLRRSTTSGMKISMVKVSFVATEMQDSMEPSEVAVLGGDWVGSASTPMVVTPWPSAGTAGGRSDPVLGAEP